MRLIKCYGKKLILRELKKSYEFFINEANTNKKSLGYGLIRDKTILANNIASIASVGYGLGSLIIGVEHKWISYKKAYDRANRTLDTFIYNVEGKNGFYYHFVNIQNGKREWNCEISIIDTAILICGAFVAGEFFKGEVKNKVEKIYKKINWNWFLNKDTNQFYMGYSRELGHKGKWDIYGEQLMVYVLSTASPTFPVSRSTYDSFEKPLSSYGRIKDIVCTYFGSLFAYQYSHAFIDFRGRKDENGIDWFENSIKATKANREYCINNKEKYKTYSENSWGLTACLTPDGYNGKIGASPCKISKDIIEDGTIATSAAIGSIVFTPEDSIKAMENYYNNFPKLWSEYGFNNSFNLCKKEEWFAKENLGIDKGIGMCMIENYLNGSIWKYFMENEYVKKGLDLLKIK